MNDLEKLRELTKLLGGTGATFKTLKGKALCKNERSLRRALSGTWDRIPPEWLGALKDRALSNAFRTFELFPPSAKIEVPAFTPEQIEAGAKAIANDIDEKVISEMKLKELEKDFDSFMPGMPAPYRLAMYSSQIMSRVAKTNKKVFEMGGVIPGSAEGREPIRILPDHDPNRIKEGQRQLRELSRGIVESNESEKQQGEESDV